MVNNFYKIKAVKSALWFTIILILSGCHKNASMKNHYKTELLIEGLYCETYRVFGGGVYGGDVYAEYLTDSVSFRFFVGKYDDNHNLAYEINKDTIIVKHLSYSNIDGAVVINKVEKLTKDDIRNDERTEKIGNNSNYRPKQKR